MTTSNPVPSDVEAESIIDLVEDCREVSGVLGSFVPTVLPHTIVLPEARTADPVEISAFVAAGLDGYEAYGS